MKLGNTHQQRLTFGTAVVVDFKDSNQGCACTRDYDSAIKAVESGAIERKGTVSYPIPVIKFKMVLAQEGDKYIVVNGEERKALEPLARKINDSNFLTKNFRIRAFFKKTQELITKGAQTIKY